MTPSVRADNQFRFLCPVLGQEARYLACVLRKHRKWRGEPSGCGACSAAMDANKCPVIHMVAMESPRNGEARAIFYDPKGEKLYQVPSKVAERIERVVILPYHCRPYEMTPEMHERLTGTTEPYRGAVQLAESSASSESPRRQGRRSGSSTTRTGGGLDDLLDHATVDLAAGLNVATD